VWSEGGESSLREMAGAILQETPDRKSLLQDWSVIPPKRHLPKLR